MSRQILLTGLAVMALASAQLAAQQRGPHSLSGAASARIAGLGGAFSGGRGPDVVFANPSQIGLERGLFAGYARYGSTSSAASLASTTALGGLSVGVFGQRVTYRAELPPVSLAALTTEGDASTVQSLTAGVTAALTVFGFRVGTSLKYVEERIEGAAGVAAIDLGVGRNVGPLSLGLVAQNLGSTIDVRYYRLELPTRIALGAASRRLFLGDYFDAQLYGTVAREGEGEIVPSAAAELIYEPVAGWTAAVRVSGRRVLDGSQRPALSPIVVGGTFGLDRFSLDYAFEPTRGGGTVHRLGVRIR